MFQLQQQLLQPQAQHRLQVDIKLEPVRSKIRSKI